MTVMAHLPIFLDNIMAMATGDIFKVIDWRWVIDTTRVILWRDYYFYLL